MVVIDTMLTMFLYLNSVYLKSEGSIPNKSCPGAHLLYNCTSRVHASPDEAEISLNITFPNQSPILVTYQTGAFIDRPITLEDNVVATLKRYSSEFVELLVTLVITPSFNIFGTSITCSTGDRDIVADRLTIQTYTIQNGMVEFKSYLCCISCE